MEDFSLEATIKAEAPTINADLTVTPPIGNLEEDIAEVAEDVEDLADIGDHLKEGEVREALGQVIDWVINWVVDWGFELAAQLLPKLLALLPLLN